MTARLEYACPHCGRLNDAHSSPDADRPGDGDVSVCWSCYGIGIFTADGIRLPTLEEKAELDADPEVRAVLAAMAESYTPSQAVGLLRGDHR